MAILTNFVRPDAPLLIETADFGHPKCRAINLINSLLALPSTGDFSWRAMDHVGPPLKNANSRAFGSLLPEWSLIEKGLGAG